MNDPRETVATETHYFSTTHEELVKLIESGIPIEVSLGTGSLIWHKGTKMPDSVYELGRMRGVFNENVAGDGI